jgi:Bacterial extracellular solute-binding proteins, family 3
MSYCRFLILLFWGILTSTGVIAADLPPRKIITPKIASYDINHEDYYFSQLLRLALKKTEVTYGPYELLEAFNWTADKRLRKGLAQNQLDVIWSATSPEFERELLPIKVSLLKELGDYRVLIIRSEDQAKFSKVQSLKDFQKFTGGMNPQWVDAPVMKLNNLPQVYAVGYGKLFKMLAAKRYDYFSRGLYQVQTEVNFYPELKLVMERDLLLHYKNEFYFFVSKENQLLASRIEQGLNLAIKDGSFDELFNSVPRYRWAMDELKNGNRRVLELISNNR